MEKPAQLQTEILERAFTEDEMEEILEQYKKAKLKSGRPISLDEVDPLYLELYDEWLEGEPMKILAEEGGVSTPKLTNIFAHIGRLKQE